MILYDPLSGDVNNNPPPLRPRSCFVMTRLGKVPPKVLEVRSLLGEVFHANEIEVLDAESVTQGRGLLHKIWRLMVSVPVGVAIVYRKMPPRTIGNVFYELGMMQALGKETVIVNVDGTALPSDVSGTEYIRFDDRFKQNLQQFVDSLRERAIYYVACAENVERNPLLAIDFYRRAYLLTGDEEPRQRAWALVGTAIGDRARNSVEMLMTSFCTPVPERSVPG